MKRTVSYHDSLGMFGSGERESHCPKYTLIAKKHPSMSKYHFADLFSGCGGLSLGLSMAGLQGRFAIERDPMAFETFSDNFLGDRDVPISKFEWPSWLEQRSWGIDDLLGKHHGDLSGLKNKIHVLAGGPPCQGFSFAGRRQADDPRNKLFKKYVEVVDAIRPSFLILENVPGMKVAHVSAKDEEGEPKRAAESFYDKLRKSLEAIGYEAHGEIVDASRFGVPQRRSRLIVIGVKKHLADQLEGGVKHAFDVLESVRREMLASHGLSKDKPVSAEDAISDLLVSRTWTWPCRDPMSRGKFEEASYLGPITPYQRLMHRHSGSELMDSMRLARHTDVVRERFKTIIRECAQGVLLSQENRDRFGLKKHRIYPMSAGAPAPTITTLPDDVLHYSEPRILTVRESARLQSFPDWFRFRGKFTTGGDRRAKECPRYTQVGNAVPPMLAKAIGLAVVAMMEELESKAARQLPVHYQRRRESLAALA